MPDAFVIIGAVPVVQNLLHPGYLCLHSWLEPYLTIAEIKYLLFGLFQLSAKGHGYSAC